MDFFRLAGPDMRRTRPRKLADLPPAGRFVFSNLLILLKV
jgi:hypothetical protein